MPALTRRRDRNLPQECWRIYYGDVRAGTIAQRVGNPGADGAAAFILAPVRILTPTHGPLLIWLKIHPYLGDIRRRPPATEIRVEVVTHPCYPLV
jgi:hypothetical protein